jgi:hypothetical protein
VTTALLTLAEAARYLRVSLSSFRRHVLPSLNVVRVGRSAFPDRNRVQKRHENRGGVWQSVPLSRDACLATGGRHG